MARIHGTARRRVALRRADDGGRVERAPPRERDEARGRHQRLPQAWLVEQAPGVAVGYVAPRAFACLELERGLPVDRGVARFQLVSAMRSVNERIGKVGRLADAIRGVSLAGSRGREMPQPHREAFVMYDVREDLAESFDCDNKLHPEQADPAKAQSTRFGEYVGAVFQVKTDEPHRCSRRDDLGQGERRLDAGGLRRGTGVQTRRAAKRSASAGGIV